MDEKVNNSLGGETDKCDMSNNDYHQSVTGRKDLLISLWTSCSVQSNHVISL